jgi:hypothetical protein
MRRFETVVRVFVAPLLTLFGGFFTTAFLFSGAYTWPRTSRTIVLSLTLLVLAYEFIYKEQRLLFPEPSDERPLKAVFSSCVIPYGIGALVFVGLAKLAH